MVRGSKFTNGMITLDSDMGMATITVYAPVGRD